MYCEKRHNLKVKLQIAERYRSEEDEGIYSLLVASYVNK
jgi:hypothetical protein